MGTGEFNARLASHPGGVEILLVASCYGNQDKLRPNGPLGSYANFTYPAIRVLSSSIPPSFLILSLTPSLCWALYTLSWNEMNFSKNLFGDVFLFIALCNSVINWFSCLLPKLAQLRSRRIWQDIRSLIYFARDLPANGFWQNIALN